MNVRVILGVLFILFLLFMGPFRTIPAGHVGVKDFFGQVSASTLAPGIRLVVPFTQVVRMSVQTQEIKEIADVPSQEGLILNLETSASYEAKALYSAERERIATEIQALFGRLAGPRGIVVQQVLLRKIGLPPVVANAIQEKLRREQEAEQMKFVVQKEQQEAERKRIEAQGIADFQRIVAQGISAQLLEWKGIEATEKLAASTNSKVVVIGNTKTGLPIILGGADR